MRIRKKYLKFVIVFLLLFSSYAGILLNLLTISYENRNEYNQDSIDSLPKFNQGSQAPLIFGVDWNPNEIDPLQIWNTVGFDMIIQCAEPLVDYNYSAHPNYHIIPKLATEWIWHSDTEISFKIRENVYFHDGTLLDAAAVKWNFDRLMYFCNYSGTLPPNTSMALTSSLYYFPNDNTPIISSVVVNGPYNISIHLNAYYVSFLDLLTFTSSYILSPTSTPIYRYLDRTSETIVGTGPFVFEYFLYDDEIKFHAYEDYWGGKANIEVLIFDIIENEVERHKAFLDKEIDFIEVPLMTYYDQIEADPDLTLLDAGEEIAYRFLDFYCGPGDPLEGNPWNYQLLNSTWRRALSLAINYTNIWEDLLQGYADPGFPAVPRNMPGYNESIGGDKDTGLGGLMALHYPFNGTFESNIKKAREYIQSMGFGTTLDPNYPGNDELNWKVASFRIIQVNEYSFSSVGYNNTKINDLLIDCWDLIGVDLNITTRGYGQYLDTLLFEPWKIEVSLNAWVPDFFDAISMLYPLFNNESINSNTHVNDPLLQEVLELTISEINTTLRNQMFMWIQSYIFDITKTQNPSSYAQAPLYTLHYYVAFHNDLTGFEPNLLWKTYFYPCTWDREMPGIPGEFILSSNADSPDTDGIFDLIWTSAENATNYTVYISSKPIIKITETVIEIMDGITSLTYPLSGLTDGTYYFIVEANNEYGKRLSNPISVNITIPGDMHSLFDDLYLEYFFRSPGWEDINATSKYTSLIGDTYSVNETSERESGWDYGTYYIDTTTRLVSNVQRIPILNYNGTHTYKWIYTNTELGDYYLITCNQEEEEDHIFQVMDENTNFFPGLGTLSVWVLYDLNVPGTIAMYEKSTGINVYSFIIGEWENLTITLNSTNAPLNVINVPGPFTLLSTAGSPDDDGDFDLVWSSSSGADNYSVYEYDKYITEINGSLITLANEITDLTIPLSGYATGTYYFIVVAHNEDGDTLSDCIEIVVSLPLPGSFTLYSTAGSPDDDGDFDLVWSSSSGAVNYSVYQYDKYITELNGSLTSLAEGIIDTTLPLNEYTNGTYYFIVAAYNQYGYTLSNCIEIIVSLPLPSPFTLSSTAEDPDDDGKFNLEWSSSSGADNYSVYEYDKYITEINGSLTTLANEITDLTISLSGYATGTYYFIIVAHNEGGDTLSNCIEILVSLALPGSFTLYSTAGSPDDDGDFDLVWSSSSGAVNYSVYQYDKYITELNGSLTSLIEGIIDINLPLNEYTNGTYYFIVAAYNQNGYTLSNCIKVEVAIPPVREKKEPGIPGYNLYFVAAILGISVISLIKKPWKKKL